MSNWKYGREKYETLISNIASYVTSDEEDNSEKAIIKRAKDNVTQFIGGLRVSDLTDIHEYLMYMSTLRPDPRFPTYVYSGGDRIISITRFLLKNIDLELSKQYA